MTWPVSPVNGQQITVNGTTYEYDSTPGVWNRVYATILTNVAVAGTNTMVQFNDGGSAFGGSANLTFNKTNNTLAVTNLTVFSGTIENFNTIDGNVLGNLSTAGYSTFSTLSDKFVGITGATGTVNHDLAQAACFYHTSIAANFQPNFTNVATTNNFATVAVLFCDNGNPAYLPISTPNVQVNGSNVSIKWVNGTAPTSPAINAVTVASFNIIRNSGSWTVLAQASYYS